MLSKQLISLLLRSNRSVISSSLRLRELSGYHGSELPEKYKPFLQATYDELPVPHGSWKEQYEKYQKKWNIQLALALVFYFITIGYLYYCPRIDWCLTPPMKNPK